MSRSREAHNAVRRQRLEAKGVIAEDIQFAKTDYLGDSEAQCCLCDTPILHNFILGFERPSGIKLFFEPVGSECITDWAEAMPESHHREALLGKVKEIKAKLAQDRRYAKATLFAAENNLYQRFLDCKAAQRHSWLRKIIKDVEATKVWKSVKQAQFFLDTLVKCEAIQESPESTKAPPCKCGALMVLRNGKFGQFWGCCTFPRCYLTQRYVVPAQPKLVALPATAEPAAPDDDDLPFDVTPTKPTQPLCPKCHKETRFQTKRQFWLCSTYPECKGFVATAEQIQQAKTKA